MLGSSRSRVARWPLAALVVVTGLGCAPANAEAQPAPSPAGVPVVTSVAPAKGSVTGFQPVVVHGRNLGSDPTVRFGGESAVQVTVRSAHELIAVAPKGSAGHRVDVQVRTASGTSARTGADRYTFLAPAPVRGRTYHFGGQVYGDVVALSCPKTSWCASADAFSGEHHRQALTVITDRRATLLPVPLPPGGDPDRAYLFAISCSAVDSCVAVGDRDYSVGAMIATLQDGQVSSIPVDGVAGLPRSVLSDVSCTRTLCAAVGTDYNDNRGTRAGAVLERAADGSWSQVPLSPLPPLTTVSCADATCVAIGYTDEPALVVRTADGWHTAAAPVPAGGTDLELAHVDCYAPGRCVASGAFTAADGLQHQVFDTWEDGVWTAVAVPRPATLTGTFFPGPLSCTGTGTCFAAGDATTYFAAASFVARLLHHRASVTPLPVPTTRGPIVGIEVTDLACSSPSFCIAVGNDQVKDPEFGKIFYFTSVLSNQVWRYADSPRSYAAACASHGFCAMGLVRPEYGAGIRSLTAKY